MQISVASSSLVSIPVIEAIKNSEHELVSIITNPDKASGRGKVVVPNELAHWASEQGLPVAKPADSSELNRHLLSAQPQLIVTIAYGRIIPVELLHGPRFGWINIHFSLLPSYRGAAPVQRAILNGESKTGFTIFKLDKGMDTGPFYVMKEIDLQDSDRTEDLLAKLTNLAILDLLELLKVIGKTKATPQTAQGISLAPKISKEEAQILWDSPTDKILRLDRALASNPGIWTVFRGERVVVHGVEESFIENDLKLAGEVAASGDALIVRTKDSILKILDVTPAGKKRMSGMDFARGARLKIGEKFE